MYSLIKQGALSGLQSACRGLYGSWLMGAGVAPEVAVRKHLVHITSPPDARYSPLSANGRPVFTEVRALVTPVIPDRSGTKFPVLPQVSVPSVAQDCVVLL